MIDPATSTPINKIAKPPSPVPVPSTSKSCDIFNISPSQNSYHEKFIDYLKLAPTTEKTLPARKLVWQNSTMKENRHLQTFSPVSSNCNTSETSE